MDSWQPSAPCLASWEVMSSRGERYMPLMGLSANTSSSPRNTLHAFLGVSAQASTAGCTCLLAPPMGCFGERVPARRSHLAA